MHLAQKTALVTGAAGALGSAMVNMLLEGGAQTVIALDKNEAALATSRQPGVLPVSCDATEPLALEQRLLGTLAQHPSVEILINNAGLLHSAPLVNVLNRDPARFSDAAAGWQEVLSANLSSVFYVTQLVADHMIRRRTKGVIINMSSISARGNAGQSAYAASKAGVGALTQVWAKELGLLGIRCVAIAPGYIDTPSTRNAMPATQLRAIEERVPLKRLGNTTSVLQAVRFAIENDYVNGTILEVDGGLSV
jgi:3-oxoacyl-[acyl-carrier protein] reductase